MRNSWGRGGRGRGGTFWGRLAENRSMRRLLWDLAWVECWAASHHSPASKLMQAGEGDQARRLVAQAAALLESRAQAEETAADAGAKRLAGDA